MPGELQLLTVLSAATASPGSYFGRWLADGDDILRVGAWCGLLEREAVTPSQYDTVFSLAQFGAVHAKAFRFFEAIWEHQRAAQLLTIPTVTEADANAALMKAEIAFDTRAIAAAQRARYLAAGRLDALLALSNAAERDSGWQAALDPAIKALLLFPHDPLAAQHLLHLLYTGQRAALLDEALGYLAAARLHPFLCGLYEAARLLLAGDARGCLNRLASLGSLPPPRLDVGARVRYLPPLLAAGAQEKLGNYRRAFEATLEMHRADSSANIRLEDFPAAIRAAGDMRIPDLPADPRVSHFIMTGFPRSGTTLLENALAMHGAIETFEEIPARASMQYFLDTTLPLARGADEREAAFVEARRRYYDEMDRRTRKPNATVFIDKMPMRSAEAKFLSRVFPDKHYIFSIRHPFDVVLSCIKQHFSPNIAMAHFRSFETAVALYDFTMEQWFSVYGLDDEKVHYLRYDDLVSDFRGSMADALRFLDLEWDETVLDFATGAAQRVAITPSYGKVRQGLSIGLQTSWRNYDFVFRSAAARPLHKWAEFFGYPTIADADVEAGAR